MSAYIVLPDGTRCYSGPNCRVHGSAIKAMAGTMTATKIDSPKGFDAAIEQAIQSRLAAPKEVLAKGGPLRQLVGGESRTYADIARSGDKGSRVVTSVDLSTPPGYFVTSVRMLGITTEYLLEGEEGDKNAKIVGRIELVKNRGLIYQGSEFKGGKYLGTVGAGSSKTFSDAFDDIALGPEPLPVAPASTPQVLSLPDGGRSRYEVGLYSDPNNTVVRAARTKGDFTKAIRQIRSEPNGAIRRVEVNFDPSKRNGYFGTESAEVQGPKDGTPLIIDYVRGYTSLDVTSGNVVINATSTYGGGVRVREGASATIITPHGKFSVTADAGSAVTVYPRAGARGGIWSDEGANVEIDHLFEHNIENHQRKRR